MYHKRYDIKLSTQVCNSYEGGTTDEDEWISSSGGRLRPLTNNFRDTHEWRLTRTRAQARTRAHMHTTRTHAPGALCRGGASGPVSRRRLRTTRPALPGAYTHHHTSQISAGTCPCKGRIRPHDVASAPLRCREIAATCIAAASRPPTPPSRIDGCWRAAKWSTHESPVVNRKFPRRLPAAADSAVTARRYRRRQRTRARHVPL